MGITEGHYRACLQGIRQRWRREPGFTATGAQILVAMFLLAVEPGQESWPAGLIICRARLSWPFCLILVPSQLAIPVMEPILLPPGREANSQPCPSAEYSFQPSDQEAWPESWEPTELILQPHSGREPSHQLCPTVNFRLWAFIAREPE